MIKVRVILEDAKIYRQMDSGKKPMAVLSPGKEFLLGKVFKETSERWVEASLPDGRKGYVTGTTKLRVIYPVFTSQKTSVYQTAESTSPILTDLPARSRVELLDVLESDPDPWSLVRLPSGQEGYLPPEVKFKREQKKKKRTPGQFAILGSALVLIGVGVRRFLFTPSGNSILETLAFTGIIAGAVLIIYSFFLAMRDQAMKKKTGKPRK